MGFESEGSHRISDDFIQDTIAFWKRKAGFNLTAEEAVEAIQNAALMLRMLGEWERDDDDGGGTAE